MLAQFREWRDQWMAATKDNPAIGEDLMIVKTASESLNPGLVTPTIQAAAAQSGYEIGIMVFDRGDAKMWDAYTRKKGGNWVKAGTFEGKTGNITITPTTPGEPEQIDVRVQLRYKNEDYGNVSQTATVTVNP